jgi:hypothetical protein
VIRKQQSENKSDLTTEYRLLTPGLLVREEREMKTAVSREMDLIGLSRSALMFPRDPIETREASLKDHP